MKSRIYCGTCRGEVIRETYQFWQGTAWCANCRQVVYGSMCKAPCWTIAAVLFLVIRLRIT
jgi:hypothetical protein